MKTETGYKCIVLDNEHGRSYYDAVKETWCKGVVVLTQKTVDAVLPKLKSKEIIAPLISVIDDPRFETRDSIIDECITKVKSLIRDNCSDHSLGWGACVSCGRVDNPDILPDPETVIEELESLKAKKDEQR